MSGKSSPPTNAPKRKWSFKSIFGRKRSVKPESPPVDGLTKSRRSDGTCQWRPEPVLRHCTSFAATEDCFTDQSVLDIRTEMDSDEDSANFSVAEGFLVHRLIATVDRGTQTERQESRAPDVSFIKVLLLPICLPIMLLLSLLKPRVAELVNRPVRLLDQARDEISKAVFSVLFFPFIIVWKIVFERVIAEIVSAIVQAVMAALLVPVLIAVAIPRSLASRTFRFPSLTVPSRPTGVPSFLGEVIKRLLSPRRAVVVPKVPYQIRRFEMPRCRLRPPRLGGRPCRCKCAVM